MRKTLAFCVAGLLLLSAGGCQPAGSFQYVAGPDSTVKPWTKDPSPSAGPLRLAILADRTGGHRAGIFEDAVQKLNLLQPDIVLCVGDLIEGYSDDTAAINRMWDEFDGLVRPLSMPFFPVRGNHDALRAELDRIWRERVGPRYYGFVYRDCLFLCLNSLDGGFHNSQYQPGISPAQLQWVRQTLAEHRGVRWTFLFMHYPLWVFDEEAVADAKPGAAPELTGFASIENALAGRDYTFFTGHFHDYAKYTRRGHDYYILATTGGSSSLKGPAAGQFDEVVWVSMTPQGPQVANLELKGILPSDVRTEAQARLDDDLRRWKTETVETNPLRVTVSMQVKNLFRKPASVSAEWNVPEGCGWTVTPKTAAIQIEPNQPGKITCVATFAGRVSEIAVVPTCDAQFSLPGEEPVKRSSAALGFALQECFEKDHPTISCKKAPAAPKIDGKLDDDAWKRTADVSAFTNWKFAQKPQVSTEGFLAWDNDNLYVAFRCQEPNMALLRSAAKGPEGVFRDDCAEFMVAPADRKTYHQFATSASGSIYYSKGGEKGSANERPTSRFTGSAARDAAGWSVEMAIPWKDLGIAPKAGMHLAVLFSRQRPQIWEVLQWPPSPAGNAHPAAFAEVILGE